MSRIEVVEYKCDVCGKVFREDINSIKKPLKYIQVPSKNYDCEGREYREGKTEIEMCDDCFKNYWDYVQERYDVSNCYGIQVKIKGDSDE